MLYPTLSLVLLLVGGVHESLAAPAQHPLAVDDAAHRPRTLHGRFLHITDVHPDPFYIAGASEQSACHRKKPKKARPRAGVFGMPYSDCDSPLTLTNFTLDYLDKQWSNEIDFVVWTGDSARHDNDRKQPRTLKEIYQLNRAMARRMEDIFVKKGIPVIPSIGNNDVWPHNIMMPGPNDVTFEFSSIWKSFVPFHSYQVFQRGGYFSVEVIPDAVAVVSLNTMYFFDSNKAVGGCEFNDPDDPGNLQFDWLDVQLANFRSRGMQVWISGHVPPSASNYHPECHVRYLELSLRYQDTILGHLFGHMNADHFFFLDARKLRSRDDDDDDDDNDNEERGSAEASAGEVEGLGKHKELYSTLLKDFNQISKAEKRHYDSLAVVNVAPSVVPNPYLPSFRIFSYNTSGTPYTPGDLGDSRLGSGGREGEGDGPLRLGDYVECEDRESGNGSWACRLSEPWHTSPESPSRTNTLWSPLGYAQYYLPNMSGSEKHPPQWKLEYLTFSPATLHPPAAGAGAGAAFAYPIPLRHLPGGLRNATAGKSKFAPYGMADLTIGSWATLAKKLAKTKSEKLRRRFKQYMYMGAGEER